MARVRGSWLQTTGPGWCTHYFSNRGYRGDDPIGDYDRGSRTAQHSIIWCYHRFFGPFFCVILSLFVSFLLFFLYLFVR